MSIDIDSTPPPPPPPAVDGKAIGAPLQAPDAAFDAPVRVCPNCGAPVQGPFCYACGQSEKGMIRHLSAVMSDLADIVFNVDSRVFRSLRDLYFRPGYMTREYIEGRRARYVTPFRLFFFLCIFSFLAMQWGLEDVNMENAFTFNRDPISSAKTPEEVQQRVDEVLTTLTIARNVPQVPEKAAAKLEQQEAKIRERAARRISTLEERARAQAGPGPDAAAQADEEEPDIQMFWFNGKAWDQNTNPLVISWLSDGINAWLNRTLAHMQTNLRRGVMGDRKGLVLGLIGVLPQTLFVMMPLFAVLLKITYLFKRRLYMEHLLVALHSHAFIFLSLLVVLALSAIGSAWADVAWLTFATGWLMFVAWVWMFVYLWLMQKRVYRHGWVMSFVTFWWVGFCYMFMLSFALMGAVLVSLAIA